MAADLLDERAWLAWSDDDYFDGPGEAIAFEDTALEDTALDDTARLPPAEAAPDAAMFGPGGPAESMPPGPALSTLVEQAVRHDLAQMPDDEVIGTVAAARRLRRHAEWLELRATREFAHRRWEADSSPVRDKDGRWRFRNSTAEHAPDELAFHLTDNRAQAQDRMDVSLALRDRLPAMDALVDAGKFDERRCQAVRANGVKAGQRDAELMCYLDLTQGRDPRMRIPDPAGPGHGVSQAGSGVTGEDWDECQPAQDSTRGTASPLPRRQRIPRRQPCSPSCSPGWG